LRTLKKVDVTDEKWDYLIVLDACRYDYFLKLYGDYLQGKLEKVCSPGSCTPEWCRKSFPEYYPDIIYVSANPFINSKISTTWGEEEFDAKKHFFKVIDVWMYGWNDELGTVPPEKVNESVIGLKNDYATKRFVIHYLQPHDPYLYSRFQTAGYPKPFFHKEGRVLKPFSFREDSEIQKDRVNSVYEKICKRMIKQLRQFKIINSVAAEWKLREMFRLPPFDPMDATRRRFGINGLRLAYSNNLRIALECIAELVEELSGDIIVTSDHGECLGENGNYSHGPGIKVRELLEVPWFRMTRKKRASLTAFDKNKSKIGVNEQTMHNERDIVRTRLEKLGYL
jgi:hypothetical protein